MSVGKGSLKGTGSGHPHVPKYKLEGRTPAWLNRELWLESQEKNESL